MVENSLHAKNDGDGHRLKYKDGRFSEAIKTAADGYCHANKCLLTLKHGTCIMLVCFCSCVVVLVAFLYKTSCLKLDRHAMIISKVEGILSIVAIAGCYDCNPCGS